MSKRENTLFIVVHCSATHHNQDIGVREIDKWHRNQGWQKIGYHKVIRRNGEIENGRGDEEIGAHAHGYNPISLGICLVGGIDESGKSENNFTFAQFESLAELLEKYTQRYPLAKVVGHRDLPKVKKDCPCFDVADWYTKYKNAIL